MLRRHGHSQTLAHCNQTVCVHGINQRLQATCRCDQVLARLHHLPSALPAELRPGCLRTRDICLRNFAFGVSAFTSRFVRVTLAQGPCSSHRPCICDTVLTDDLQGT